MAMAQLFFLDIKRNRFSLYILNLNKEYETEPIYNTSVNFYRKIKS